MKSNNFLPNDPLLANQWHLANSGQAGQVGNDVNVIPAWQSVTGKGVVIGVIDDGLQHTHPDLRPNYRPDLSYDFDDNDKDPSPAKETFDGESFLAAHGTAVAGVAAAAGNNSEGVTGVAPNASIAGLKLNAFDETVDKKEAQALTHKNQEIDIYNASWGPQDDGKTLEAPGALTQAALKTGVTKGRGGLGSIFVWSAGNGLEANDNVNYDGYANSRYTIAIGAIDANAKQAPYSEPGAAMLTTTYSDGNEPNSGITTTDLQGKQDGYSLEDQKQVDQTGNYTNSFGGTSSSAPLASGVVALMLEANPNLTWRDVQHLLVNTAAKNDSSDSDWKENGAGHLVNHKYGFGSIDASAVVKAAKSWNTVAPEVSAASEEKPLNTYIIDNKPQGVTSIFKIEKDIKLESVELKFDATHAFRGDLEVTLTSPDGTKSILAEQHNDAHDDYSQWTFSSVRHWGESSLGDWTVKVADKAGNDITGFWNTAQLKVFGTENKSNPLDNLKSINGTAKNDTLAGTPEDNLIFGREGNDILSGNAGNDVIRGGDGNDTLDGDLGRNKLFGETGNDLLTGGTERDSLHGGLGKDILVGNKGDDLLTGGLGADTLTGGAGSDRFIYGSTKEGGDLIKDFDLKHDLLDLHQLFDPLKSNPEQSSIVSLLDQHMKFEQIGSNTAVKFSQNGSFENKDDFTTLATLENISADDLGVDEETGANNGLGSVIV
ncbi:putative Furin [Hyella patelloides LEGE 07179]|uniref:Putative Furin n=1 Tax=Hyella patelloides LEGE 07179 TaxID=945734 RepID=A0A563VTI3_9CYAN|nr:S8 family serine peptidase [Hyella patelloides]VEP14708.1 putative Furin [Hyella patelloides LEGE 07179]